MKKDMTESKAAYVHSVFESIARDYDRMNSVISLGMPSPVALENDETFACAAGGACGGHLQRNV